MILNSEKQRFYITYPPTLDFLAFIEVLLKTKTTAIFVICVMYDLYCYGPVDRQWYTLFQMAAYIFNRFWLFFLFTVI